MVEYYLKDFGVESMSFDDKYDYVFQIVLFGDAGVGKSNIVDRLVSNGFSLEYKHTVGCPGYTKVVNLDGKLIKFQIWDTSGGENKYRAISSAHYGAYQGAILVYDITKKTTYEKIPQYIDDLVGEPSVMLVGNKWDEKHSRAIPTEKAMEFAEINEFSFMEVSALDATNVNLMFERLARNMLDKRQQNERLMQSPEQLSLSVASGISYLQQEPNKHGHYLQAHNKWKQAKGNSALEKAMWCLTDYVNNATYLGGHPFRCCVEFIRGITKNYITQHITTAEQEQSAYSEMLSSLGKLPSLGLEKNCYLEGLIALLLEQNPNKIKNVVAAQSVANYKKK